MTPHLNARAAATLVGALVDGGVRALVFSPGSRSTPLVLAALAHPALATWPVLDERGAAFMALGLARASGRPVALLCTSGTAAAHWLPAVIEARLQRLPLVLLTADRPPEKVGSGAGQTIDQRRLFGAYVAFEAQLPVPEAAVPPAVFAAFGEDALLACGAGPVHLNVPFREPLWTPEADYRPPPARVGRAPAPPAADALDGLVALARGARRPIIYAGSGAPPGLETLSTLGWPLLVEAASGGRFGPGEGRVTAYEALARGPFAACHVPDFILHFGAAPHARALEAWLGEVPIALVDPHGDRRDPGFRALGRWRAGPVEVAAALAGSPGPEAGWQRAWLDADRVARAALDAACDAGLWEGRLARSVARSLPAGAALHVASSMPFRDLDAFTDAGGPAVQVTANRGASGIDGTVACALGAALAGAPTVALLGDLALIHDAGGLLLAGEHRDGVRLTLVVADNGGGGIFEYLPIAGLERAAFERAFLTPQRTDLAALAAAAGIRHHRVSTAEALDAVLGQVVGRPGVDLVQVVIDRADNVARHRAAWAAAAEAQ